MNLRGFFLQTINENNENNNDNNNNNNNENKTMIKNDNNYFTCIDTNNNNNNLNLQPNDVFDIQPIHGIILPKESIDISFSFEAEFNTIAKTKAICQVIGGPEYSVTMQGASNSVSFKIFPESLNFETQKVGEVIYNSFCFFNF